MEGPFSSSAFIGMFGENDRRVPKTVFLKRRIRIFFISLNQGCYFGNITSRLGFVLETPIDLETSLLTLENHP